MELKTSTTVEQMKLTPSRLVGLRPSGGSAGLITIGGLAEQEISMVELKTSMVELKTTTVEQKKLTQADCLA